MICSPTQSSPQVIGFVTTGIEPGPETLTHNIKQLTIEFWPEHGGP